MADRVTNKELLKKIGYSRKLMTIEEKQHIWVIYLCSEIEQKRVCQLFHDARNRKEFEEVIANLH